MVVVVVVVGEDAQAPLRTTEGDGGGWCWAADGESLVGGEKLETGGHLRFVFLFVFVFFVFLSRRMGAHAQWRKKSGRAGHGTGYR